MSENGDHVIIRKNATLTAFRVLLWLLPTGFALMSAYGYAVWSRHLPFGSGLSWSIWLTLNGVFILATGWYNALLSANASGIRYGLRNRVILFFLIQPFIIVFFSCIALGWLDPGGSC